MPNEKWDLFDSEYQFKCVYEKGKDKMIPDGLYHKTIEVIPTDMEGHILVTQRAMTKRSGAGLFEFPAGSVISGETEEEAAARELREETGLWPKKVYFLQRYRMRGVIRYTYLAYIPNLMEAKLNLPPEEVMGYRYLTFKQWMAMLTTQDYNAYRTKAYNIKLYEIVETLVNRYANEETLNPPKKEPLKPLRHSSKDMFGTKPKHLDERCYEKEVQRPQGMEDWEPTCEQGDDGAV